MKNLKRISALLCALSVGYLMSCKKDEATPIDEKPAPDVVYSDWIAAKNFRDTTIDNSNLRIADLAAPEINAETMNSSIIQIYLDYGGGPIPLPYTSIAGGKENMISFLPKLKKLIITRFTTDNSRSVALSTLLKYRYVILQKPQNKAATVDLKNYEAVKNHYNLLD